MYISIFIVFLFTFIFIWKLLLFRKEYPIIIKPESFTLYNKENSKNSFTIISMNAQVLPNKIFSFHNKRWNMIKPLFKKCDIICFQELFGIPGKIFIDPRDVVYRESQLNGMKTCLTSKSVPLFTRKIIDSGLFISSKYDMIDYHQHNFSNRLGLYHSDQFASKGFIGCLFEIGNKIVYIITTHLQASYYNGDKGHKIRKKQIKKILDFTKTINKYPIIICGDLNFDLFNKYDYEYLINIMKEYGFTTIDNKKPTTFTLTHFNGSDLHSKNKYDSGYSPNWLDHVWIKGCQIKSFDVIESDLEWSDHNPIICEVYLN